MAVLESGLRKALAGAARFLPQLTRRAEAALIADHQPITGTGSLNGHGAAFWLKVAVAPNHSPEALDPVEFVDRADELARRFFADEPFYVEYSGSAELRLVAGTPPELSRPGTTHMLRIFPNGLVMLQWVLQATPIPCSEPGVELSLDEIVAVLHRMYELAHSPQFAGTHRRRRLVRHRLDWRVGLSSSITGERGPIFWRSLTSSARLPDRAKHRQNPHCPFDGYAAGAMNDRKLTDSVGLTFKPALQALFISSGYSGKITEAVAGALETPALDTSSPGTAKPEITAD
ncbi:hypothetical protein [Actinoplanes sp. RD1]|uniref:hypothetical protein n=1 Tax=Actinoplanes sp. RD1 TaxID=3064538 RepID=UPI002740EF16|nr:hypothetical protein [Actinoplanes sp. RD1]